MGCHGWIDYDTTKDTRMLLDDIKQAKIQAMKNKDSERRDILGVVIGTVQQGNDSSDDAVIRVCQKIIKGNNETLTALRDSGLSDSERSKQLVSENSIIESYLPVSWTEEEVRSLIALNQLDINGASSDGAAIGIDTKSLRETSKAPFDGKMIRDIVSSIRGGS